MLIDELIHFDKHELHQVTDPAERLLKLKSYLIERHGDSHSQIRFFLAVLREEDQMNSHKLYRSPYSNATLALLSLTCTIVSVINVQQSRNDLCEWATPVAIILLIALVSLNVVNFLSSIRRPNAPLIKTLEDYLFDGTLPDV